MWTYLSYGPFDTAEEYIAFLERMFSGSDPSLYAIVDLQTEKALGVLSYLRIFPAQATIEVCGTCLGRWSSGGRAFMPPDIHGPGYHGGVYVASKFWLSLSPHGSYFPLRKGSSHGLRVRPRVQEGGVGVRLQ